MFGKSNPMKRSGFTLIEIVVVIVIIGIMAAIIVPNLRGPTALYERKAFIEKFNSLLFLGWQQALITHTIQEIKYNIKEKKISLLSVPSFKSDGTPEEKEPKGLYRPTVISIPEQFELINFFIEGYDEMSKGDRAAIYFFIMPDGLAQDVIINISDTKDPLPNGDPRPVGLELNPFTVQLKTYDTFRK